MVLLEQLKQLAGQLTQVPLRTNWPGAQPVQTLVAEQVKQRGLQGRQVESVALRKRPVKQTLQIIVSVERH